jgi:hypothetical protein
MDQAYKQATRIIPLYRSTVWLTHNNEVDDQIIQLELLKYIRFLEGLASLTRHETEDDT